VKLVDFGTSKELFEHSQDASTYLGTPLYMAPEVLKLNIQSDL
jgi:serine/threonine protein kinase